MGGTSQRRMAARRIGQHQLQRAPLGVGHGQRDPPRELASGELIAAEEDPEGSRLARRDVNRGQVRPLRWRAGKGAVAVHRWRQEARLGRLARRRSASGTRAPSASGCRGGRRRWRWSARPPGPSPSATPFSIVSSVRKTRSTATRRPPRPLPRPARSAAARGRSPRRTRPRRARQRPAAIAALAIPSADPLRLGRGVTTFQTGDGRCGMSAAHRFDGRRFARSAASGRRRRRRRPIRGSRRASQVRTLVAGIQQIQRIRAKTPATPSTEAASTRS